MSVGDEQIQEERYEIVVSGNGDTLGSMETMAYAGRDSASGSASMCTGMRRYKTLQASVCIALTVELASPIGQFFAPKYYGITAPLFQQMRLCLSEQFTALPLATATILRHG
ncbi:conserved hypothetical protein [Ricinus communis]|uniref:Uncharacterized protein n=1 Tax=Ricinus communis TaxID=3988 RepID=B9T7I0_RICCO|nr:conserved hypothetical protein [Ricinus communis]